MKLSISEKLGYASGDFASNLFWQTFMFFFLIFYTDVFGLPMGIASSLYGLSRILDGITDPLLIGSFICVILILFYVLDDKLVKKIREDLAISLLKIRNFRIY